MGTKINSYVIHGDQNSYSTHIGLWTLQNWSSDTVPELHIQNPGPYKSGLWHRWYLTTHTGHWTLQKWSNEVDTHWTLNPREMICDTDGTSLHTHDLDLQRWSMTQTVPQYTHRTLDPTELVCDTLHTHDLGPYRSGLWHSWYLITHTACDTDSTSLHIQNPGPYRSGLWHSASLHT